MVLNLKSAQEMQQNDYKQAFFSFGPAVLMTARSVLYQVISIPFILVIYSVQCNNSLIMNSFRTDIKTDKYIRTYAHLL